MGFIIKKILPIFSIILIFIHYLNGEQIECKNTQVWGPGLDPLNVIMPARYFFIKTYDIYNNSVSSSPGKNFYQVQISGDNEEHFCKIWFNLLDAKDGSFIVRYKVQNRCNNLRISIKCQEENIPNSPYEFPGVTYSDDCSCLINDDIDDWIKKYKCNKEFPQIKKDLTKFKSIDFDSLLPIAEKSLFNDALSKSVCHYLIKDNKIHRNCYGQYTGFKMFMDTILLFFTRKVHLPDLEMLINLGDWPLIKKNSADTVLPLFSWCGSDETHDIVMPTYDITESSLENMGRVTMDMLSVQGNIAKTWNNKIEKLFWKGRDSSRERLLLINLSRQHSDIMNASLTDFFFFKNLEDKYGPREKRISFFDFFEFKYQINMDGTVAAYRFPYLLVSDSLIFKQDSSYYEHFYKDLKAWKHFVPVKRDLSDLVEKVKWAISNDPKALEIAKQSQKFARNYLLPHDIFCYHAQLFKEYSTKFGSKSIVMRPGMEKVEQNVQKQCQCANERTTSSSRILEDL